MITMKNLLNFVLPAILTIAVQGCSLPKYDAGTYVPGSSNPGVSTSSTDPVNSRPTDGTTLTGATPTGANSGTSPFSAGAPSMGTANSTSSGISGDDLASGERTRENTNFITEAATSVTSVIELSELAKKSAQSDAVKKLAASLVKDYEEANDELRNIAGAKSITMPQNTPAGLKKLSAAAPQDFDQSYLKMISLGQQKTLGIFKQASQFSDPVIKAYAAKYVPVLKVQQKQAITLSKQLR